MEIPLLINSQQLDFIERNRATHYPDLSVADMVRRALLATAGERAGSAAKGETATSEIRPNGAKTTSKRQLVERFELAAATGRAIPVLKGQVLSVTQIADGQCLDFNAYNLHDHREVCHSGRTRGLNGVNPTLGAHLWSAPPRERPMFTIIEDTVGCNDVTYSRCSAFLYEYHYGFDGPIAHSNCHDTFTEAIREWGLETDDVHDSFNGFMNTPIIDGRLAIDRMLAREGDRLEFLAQIDALAVVVCCGGDLGATNNYALKGLEVALWEGTQADHENLVDMDFVHQRTPDGGDKDKVHGLECDPNYVANWPWHSRVEAQNKFQIELSSEENQALDIVRDRVGFNEMSDETLLRYVFFQWLEQRHRRS